ncbi:MAG: 6-hydroxymethylpterin diphosphokinase MptE-like protein [Leptolyngbyaceae cyanobacterium]
MSPNPALMQQRAQVNPYRYGAFEMWNRLKWDINPESWRSRKKLQSWRNKYSGQKAVIACNGPSLLKSDLSLLEDIFVFGLNKIHLLFDKSDFRPSCIVAVNPFVIQQTKEFYNSTDIPLFINSIATKSISSRENVAFLHLAQQNKFAKDCSISLNPGFTVTYVAMQLAFHMGFDEVALIGCDHNFASKGPANAVVTAEEKDENHFDPNYFSGGVKWQLPDLVMSEMFYCRARDMFEAHDKKVVNCTEGGKLDVFQRAELKSWI